MATSQQLVLLFSLAVTCRAWCYSKHDFAKNKAAELTEIVAPRANLKRVWVHLMCSWFTMNVHEDGFLNTFLTNKSGHSPSVFLSPHSPFYPPDYTFLLNIGYPTPVMHKRKLKISLLLVFPTPLRHVFVSLCWRFNEGLTEQCRDSSMRLDLSEQSPHIQAASGQGAGW